MRPLFCIFYLVRRAADLSILLFGVHLSWAYLGTVQPVAGERTLAQWRKPWETDASPPVKPRTGR